jgi:hypothetical protein
VISAREETPNRRIGPPTTIRLYFIASRQSKTRNDSLLLAQIVWHFARETTQASGRTGQER